MRQVYKCTREEGGKMFRNRTANVPKCWIGEVNVEQPLDSVPLILGEAYSYLSRQLSDSSKEHTYKNTCVNSMETSVFRILRLYQELAFKQEDDLHTGTGLLPC